MQNHTELCTVQEKLFTKDNFITISYNNSIETNVPDLFCEQNEKSYVANVPKHMNIISNNTCPSVNLLKHNIMASLKYYEVNGECFVEDEEAKSMYDDDETSLDFEVYKVEKPGGSCEDFTTPLNMYYEVLPQGVMINSNVFLRDSHWHTMALLDEKLFRCAVCEVFCERSVCEDHIKTTLHLRNLEAYPPLKRFDLSIVRKINKAFHCGVCNEIFDIQDYKIHENSKSHEEYLLTAINKVSDVMFDSNIHAHSDQRTFHVSDRQIDRSMSNRNATNRDSNTVERIEEYHFDANALHNMNSNVSDVEDTSDDEDSMSFEEEIYDKEDIVIRHVMEEKMEEEIPEYVPPREGFSYAAAAKTSGLNLPKFLIIDIGTKNVRVSFESWHMILRIEPNNFYCMACKKRDHWRFKSEHCVTCEHAERLARCSVVRAYENYLIRKVDDMLYHCGHCNNLQCRDQMESHIETTHPKVNRNYIEVPTTQNKTSNKSSKNIIEPKKTESDKRTIVNKDLEYLETEPKKPMFDVFGDIPLSPFGCDMRIPALNFNFISKKDEEFFCYLCDKVCVDVSNHVHEVEHVELMTVTPFIKPFQNHLTRAVRNMLHCSLCNKLLPFAEIKEHNFEQEHTNALANAFGMKKGQVPNHISRKIYVPTFLAKTEPSLPNTDLGSNVQPLALPLLPTMVNNVSDLQKLSPLPNDIQADNKNKSQDSLAKTLENHKKNSSSVSNMRQNSAAGGQMPILGQNLPTTSQNVNEIGPVHHIPMSNPAISSIPPMMNSMYPLLQPTNVQILNQPFHFPVPPFSYLSPYSTPNLLSPNTSNVSYNPVLENDRKPLIITNKNDAAAGASITGNDSSRHGIDNSKLNKVNSRCNSDNYKSEINNSNNITINTLETDSQSDDDCRVFNEEDMVYVKWKTNYFKISNGSYHTLVFLDNGLRFCFVCSSVVPVSKLQNHVSNRTHYRCVTDNKFLDKYGVQLFRQMYLMYHCGICNVLMSRKEVKTHLEWALHVNAYDQAHVTLGKKKRKELIPGVTEHVVHTQKEQIYHNVNEPNYVVRAAYQIVPNLHVDEDSVVAKPSPEPNLPVKKNKLVIQNNLVMKISFNNWHSVARDERKCTICQMQFASHEMLCHVESEYHAVSLGKPFEKAYYPALIRKINASLVNCMTCNLELPNSEDLIGEHLQGRKHLKNMDAILHMSSHSDSYADCCEDILNL